MSHKISFSYCFYDELERVYEYFKNFYYFTEITMTSIISKAKKIKGDSFDEEGAVMEVILKNNNLKSNVTVENVRSSPLFKSYEHHVIFFDKIQREIHFEFKFYWDSCEKKTIFFFVYNFNEELFSPIKDLISDKEKENFCRKIEECLKHNFNGLEFSKGIFINDSIEKLWNFINNWQNINEILLKKFKLVTEIKGNFEKLNSLINVFNIDKNYLYCSLILKKIFMSENKIELYFSNIEKNVYLPNLSINISFIKMSKNNSFMEILINPNEHLSFDVKNLLSKSFQKFMTQIKEVFLPKKKNHC